MTKFRFIPTLVLAMSLLLLLTGCASAPKVPKTAAEAEIQSGITGKTVTITDEAQVKQVLDAFRVKYPKPARLADPGYGYLYSVTFRDANGADIAQFTVTDEALVKTPEHAYVLDSKPIVAQIEAAISAQK